MKSSLLKRIGIGLVSFLAVCVVLIAWLKVPTPTSENTKLVSGMVTFIGTPCCEDVGIRLAGDSHFYYINRGVESGMDVEALAYELQGEHVDLRIIETRWSPLNPDKQVVPVAEIIYEDEVLFSSMTN